MSYVLDHHPDQHALPALTRDELYRVRDHQLNIPIVFTALDTGEWWTADRSPVQVVVDVDEHITGGRGRPHASVRGALVVSRLHGIPVLCDLVEGVTAVDDLGQDPRVDDVVDRHSRVVMPTVEARTRVAWARERAELEVLLRLLAIDPTMLDNGLWSHNPTVRGDADTTTRAAHKRIHVLTTWLRAPAHYLVDHVEANDATTGGRRHVG